MRPKKLTKHGEEHYLAQLTEQDVLDIRNALASKRKNMAQLAEEKGVRVNTVQAVWYGRTWKHVGGPIKATRYGPKPHYPVVA